MAKNVKTQELEDEIVDPEDNPVLVKKVDKMMQARPDKAIVNKTEEQPDLEIDGLVESLGQNSDLSSEDNLETKVVDIDQEDRKRAQDEAHQNDNTELELKDVNQEDNQDNLVANQSTEKQSNKPKVNVDDVIYLDNTKNNTIDLKPSTINIRANEYDDPLTSQIVDEIISSESSQLLEVEDYANSELPTKKYSKPTKKHHHYFFWTIIFLICIVVIMYAAYLINPAYFNFFSKVHLSKLIKKL